MKTVTFDEALKPCRFCQGPDSTVKRDHVLCEGCMAQGPFAETAAEARKLWNAPLPNQPTDVPAPEAPEAQFLLDRLADFGLDGDSMTDEGSRQWHGHVRPAIARLQSSINSAPAVAGDAVADAEVISLSDEHVFWDDDGHMWTRRGYLQKVCADHAILPTPPSPDAEALRGELRNVDAENATLRAALEPFAKFASVFGFEKLPDHMPMTMGSSLALKQVPAGDFKRAAKALALIEKPKGGAS